MHEATLQDITVYETPSYETPLYETPAQELPTAVARAVGHRVAVHRAGPPRRALSTQPARAGRGAQPAEDEGALATAPTLGSLPGSAAVATGSARALRLTRRGRLVLLAAFISLLFLAFSVGRVVSNAAGPQAGKVVTTHAVVVGPGDTAWSLATASMPHLDGRDAVDRLLALNHSDGRLRVGQTLVVPGP